MEHNLTEVAVLPLDPILGPGVLLGNVHSGTDRGGRGVRDTQRLKTKPSGAEGLDHANDSLTGNSTSRHLLPVGKNIADRQIMQQHSQFTRAVHTCHASLDLHDNRIQGHGGGNWFRQARETDGKEQTKSAT